MSVRVTPSAISFHDFLTRILPGGVILGPAVFLLPISQFSLLENTTAALVVGLLASFLLGEGVELLRSSTFRVPWPLRMYLYKATDHDKNNLTKLQYTLFRLSQTVNSVVSKKSFVDILFSKFSSIERFIDWFPSRESESLSERFDFDFKESMESQWGIEFDQTAPTDVYDLLVLELEATMGRDTHRYRSLHAFTSNIRIASISGVILYGLVFLDAPSNTGFLYAFLMSSIIAAYSLTISIMFEAVSTRYLESLFKEYYVKFGYESTGPEYGERSQMEI